MKWFPDDAHKGDLIRIPVGSFYHYGVYISDDEVIQFGPAPVGGLARDESTIRIEKTDIDGFSFGIIPEIAHLDHAEKKKAFEPDECADRARSRIGEGGYSLLHNNCEHFATWCLFGECKCEATDTVRSKWAALFGKTK